ncbi:hypothetical protein K1719_014704 [Acacia pycnantha]|nr:hypothetical protein K1719_014704 [Acacia pycnantha]
MPETVVLEKKIVTTRQLNRCCLILIVTLLIFLHQEKDKGLISAGFLRQEIDKRKKHDWLRFKLMDPTMGGREAEPLYRDKITGKRISKEQYLKSKKSRRSGVKVSIKNVKLRLH